MAFPPTKGGNSQPLKVNNAGPTSTGGGGIPKSLKIKAAGTKNAPGFDKDVNTF